MARDRPSARIHCCWTEPLRARVFLIGVCIDGPVGSVGALARGGRLWRARPVRRARSGGGCAGSSALFSTVPAVAPRWMGVDFSGRRLGVAPSRARPLGARETPDITAQRAIRAHAPNTKRIDRPGCYYRACSTTGAWAGLFLAAMRHGMLGLGWPMVCCAVVMDRCEMRIQAEIRQNSLCK